jgi:glutamate--cysteine ligase catalytic subunit
MEAQLTDFENAAFTVMTVLISRVLLSFRLNLYVPLSKVDENMATAHE